MKSLNPDQQYFVEEFYEDYTQGLISRREFVRRVAFITGSMAATVVTLGMVGCGADELPHLATPMPIPEPPARAVTAPSALDAAATPKAGISPVPGAQSPLSVPEGDPGLLAEEISYDSGERVLAYSARSVEGEGLPAVLICHENRGLTAHIRDITRRFARAGYYALAPDLLSREGGTDSLDPDQIPGLLGAAGSERHILDFRAAYDFLQTVERVDGTRVAMTGYCFGGGVTWDVATRLVELKAAVPFYGRAPDLAAVSDIRAAMLAVYAEQDSRINAGIPQLEEALQDAGTTYQINVYPGVEHAFHNDTGSRYVEAQATRAWQDTLAWFAKYV